MVNSFSEVFLTDGHWRKTLAATRALGKQNLHVTVGESSLLSTAGFSRYCRRRMVYPSPHFRPSDFVEYLYHHCKKHPVQMLLPMEDETLDLLSEHLDLFAKVPPLPIASRDKLRAARDKGGIIRMAEALGIPVPKTWHIDELSQLEEVRHCLPYPVVIKPNIGSGAVGISYPHNSDELVDHYLAVHRRFPFPLIQERIPQEGPGYGASFLFDEKSCIRAAFVHKRLREYPVTGGASTARISVRHDEIRDMAESLLKALNWFGIAMVEFKVDPRDNTPKLMEINPRFWGSLALAVHSGVNFPFLLYRMARGERFKPVESYRLGVTCRWLLPGDMLHFIRNPHRSMILSEFFRFRGKNLHYDIISLKDPIPAMIKILSPLTFLYDADMKMRLEKRKK